MNVIVVGGTGFVGAPLCRNLVDRGHDVTVLSRDPFDADLPDEVERVAGDVTAYDSIEGAFEGQDVAVNLVALSPLFTPKGGERIHEVVHLGGTEHVVQAAEEHGLERVVQQSALGADPAGPTHYLRAKGRAERVVRDAAIEWVVIRPSIIFGDGGEFITFTRRLTPPLVAPMPGGGRTPRFQPIWVGDFAPMAADAAVESAHAGHTYEIGGPERLTLAEVGKLIRKARGHPVAVVPIPMALAGFGLAVMGAVPGFPMGSDQYRSLKLDNSVTENDIDAFGVSESDLLTLGDYLGVNERRERGSDRTAPADAG